MMTRPQLRSTLAVLTLLIPACGSHPSSNTTSGSPPQQAAAIMSACSLLTP